MTREDAIYEIRQLAVLSTNKNIERITEALNMAIEALTFQQGEWVNEIGRPISDNHSVYCSIYEADTPQTDTHDLRTDTHECVKDTHDKTEPNSSEKPNNSTISKMEQVDKDINVRSKDKPQTDCEDVWRAGYKTGYDKGFRDAQKVNDSQDLVKDLIRFVKGSEQTERSSE